MVIGVLASVTLNSAPKTMDFSINAEDIGNNQVRFTDKTHNVSLVYPKGWSRQDTNLPAYSSPDGSIYAVVPVLRPPGGAKCRSRQWDN